MQEDLDDANNQLNQLRNQPPPVVDRKSPAPPPRRASSPSPPPTPVPVPTQTRPAPTVQIHLPQYCPSVVRKINTDPNFLNRFRSETKAQLRDELSQYDNLGVTEVSFYDPTKKNIIDILCCRKIPDFRQKTFQAKWILFNKLDKIFKM